MLDAVQIFLIAVCLLLLVVLFALYIGDRSDYKNNLLHKAWNSFLCEYLKFDAHVNRGIGFIRDKKSTLYEEEFSKYHLNESHPNEIRKMYKKEQCHPKC